MRTRVRLALAALGVALGAAALACTSGTTPDCTLVDCGSPAEGGVVTDAGADVVDGGADGGADGAGADGGDGATDARADAPSDAPTG